MAYWANRFDRDIVVCPPPCAFHVLVAKKVLADTQGLFDWFINKKGDVNHER